MHKASNAETTLATDMLLRARTCAAPSATSAATSCCSLLLRQLPGSDSNTSALLSLLSLLLLPPSSCCAVPKLLDAVPSSPCRQKTGSGSCTAQPQFKQTVRS